MSVGSSVPRQRRQDIYLADLQNWGIEMERLKIEASLQTTPEVLEDMSDRLILDVGRALKVFVGGRKLRCFRCGLKGYVHTSSYPQKT